MKDSIKWSVVGGLIGLILIVIATWVLINVLKVWPSLKFDEMLIISFTIYSGVFVWAFNLFNRRRKKEDQHIYEELDKKATKHDVENLTSYLNNHKETNEAQFDAIHEILTFIDTKLDILIKGNNGKD